MSKLPIEQVDSNDAPGRDRREFMKTGLGATAALLLPGMAAGADAPSRTANAAKKVLVINAHQRYPGISEGRLNRAFAALIKDEMEKKGYEVNEPYIEQGYGIDDEVQKHLWANIITQSPVFSFGSPWIYKKYVDEVFTAGMIQKSFLTGDGRTPDDPSKQYGTCGKLQGKKYMLSLTMNAPKEVFDDKSQFLHAGRSVDELFSSNTSVYKFCGVEILPTFGSFDAIKAPQVIRDMERLKQRLAIL